MSTSNPAVLSSTSQRSQRRAVRAAERGMTLLEIMVVLVIIGLVVGIIGVNVLGRLEEANVKTAATQIKQIGAALDLYKLNFRTYPSSGEGLQALVAPKGNAQPFMKELPQDPWGRDYIYIFPGSNNPGGFDLMSYGKDGVQGGGDDVANWSQPQTQ
jgi:general secretion pathway protein G